MEKSTTVTYVSVWDDSDEIESSAQLNTETGEVYSIQTVDVSGLDLNNRTKEYILLENGSKETVEYNEERGGYFIVKSQDEAKKGKRQ